MGNHNPRPATYRLATRNVRRLIDNAGRGLSLSSARGRFVPTAINGVALALSPFLNFLQQVGRYPHGKDMAASAPSGDRETKLEYQLFEPMKKEANVGNRHHCR
jgi:hypothetical protein